MTPNFWSSWAVARNSCVDGVHAAVHAQRARAARGRRAPGIREHPLDLDLAVDDDRADAGGDRALELGDRLVVAVEPDAGGVGARGQRDGELAAGAHVDREARLGHPAHDLAPERNALPA